MEEAFLYDVCIIGGGPAGLSAALYLGRSRRTVALFDAGGQRNAGAIAVSGYLGLEGIAPAELIARGRREVVGYGVRIFEAEVERVERNTDPLEFLVTADSSAPLRSRRLILATGVADDLPEIGGLRELFGKGVFHCPYCDAWEARGKRIAILGCAQKNLCAKMRSLSEDVVLCADGEALDSGDAEELASLSISVLPDRISRVEAKDGWLGSIVLASGQKLPCEALFVHPRVRQRSSLPARLGVTIGDSGMVQTDSKGRTNVDGVFVAGDANGNSQFAIVAAADGAKAAVAVDRSLGA